MKDMDGSEIKEGDRIVFGAQVGHFIHLKKGNVARVFKSSIAVKNPICDPAFGGLSEHFYNLDKNNILILNK
jgi:hypothetical protein